MSSADDALAQAQALIPAEVRMISGCRDEQTSADGACARMIAKFRAFCSEDKSVKPTVDSVSYYVI
jgi:hypothetical protein